jgi:hypothetical protein
MLALLPGLYWNAGPETASTLRRAAIEQFSAPPERLGSWKQLGFSVTPLSAADLQKRIKLTRPGIDRKVQVASATTAPWVDANGWRIRRQPAADYWYDLPARTAPLAAAEAFAYGAHAILKIDPSDVDSLGQMLHFFRSLPERTLPEVADFGLVDDGSESAAEILNLLNRRNLLFRVLRTPDPHLRLNVTANSDDPHLFAAKVREHLTDDQRSLRVYGSEVVLCRLEAEGGQARIHVLNYGGRPLDGVRLRIRGNYGGGKLYAPGDAKPLADFTTADAFTEFSIPQLGPYAVIDLR